MIRKTLITLTLGIGLLLAAAVPSSAAPTHNETTLSYFSCGATRPDPDGPGPYTGASMTVNHSHKNVADSSAGHYDAFDCEDYLVGSTNGCIWRTYYIYDGDPDIGVFGPIPDSIHCYGFS